MFPVNLIIGGVIGSAVTYVYKDDKARQWALDTHKKLKESGKSFIASFRKKPDEAPAVKAEPATGEVAEVVDAAAVTTAPETV